MANPRITAHPITILCLPGQSVKARIAGAGLRLGRLAKVAGMPQSSLHGYISGKRRGIGYQLAIADAFRKITGQRLDASTFWGDLWGEQAVKALIIAAGIPMGRLAKESGLSGPSLTQYVNGHTRNALGQVSILKAFRKISKRAISADEFWGVLWAESNRRQENVA